MAAILQAKVVFPEPLPPRRRCDSSQTYDLVMVADVEVQAFESIPEDISVLLEASQAEGYDFVERLVDDWQEGSNRFQLPGEVAVAARIRRRLVGVGGLNIDPYLDDPGVGRIRHVYVSPDVRSGGVGRVLVMALLDHARGRFDRLRLRTVTPAGAAFYKSLGFEETGDEANATHQIRLS